MRDVFTPINRTLSQVWKKVYPSVVHMFSFADSYGFNLASDTYDVAELDIEEVDKRIEERIKGGTKVLKFYDGTTHRSIHHLPKHVRAAVASEERTITESKPLYVRNYGQDQTPF
jgi:thermospermine synthase